MNTISKDQSIITQVAAKIAADLTPKTDDLQTNVGNWVVAFDVTLEALLDKHGMTGLTDEQVVEVAQQVFPNSVVVTQTSTPQWATQQAQPQASGFQVRVKGKQHGDIPEWLITACRRDGVSKVYDNRDGLAVNAKRPWFKSVVGEKAYWAPKPRR